MKKIFLLIHTVCFALFIKSQAQPVITSAVMPLPGQYEVSINVNPAGINEGPSGANQTWNFPTLTPVDSSTAVYYNASSTPYTAFFPMSNIGIQQLPITSPGYFYASVNADSGAIHGVVFELNNDTFVINYINPEKIIEFPATYNSTMMDSYEVINGPNEITPGLIISGHTVGTISYVADAYGTLTTPGGICTSALRLKRHREQVDTSFINGIPDDITQEFETQYSWLCAGGGATFNITYDTTISTQNGTNYDKNVSYSGGVFTEINEIQKNDVEVLLAPNPVNNMLTVSVSGLNKATFLVRVNNTLGQQIYAAEKQNHATLDLTNLKPGIYFLTIENENGPIVRKFVKD